MSIKKLVASIGMLMIGLYLTGCGPSQAELDTEATRVGVNQAAAQTVENLPPTQFPTPIPPTYTSTPTDTPVSPTHTSIPTSTLKPLTSTPTPTSPPTVDRESTVAAEKAQQVAGLLEQGIANIEAEDYEQAVENLSQVIALEPDNAEAYYQRGRAYGGLEDLKQALADYSKAIALKPDYAEAYHRRGAAYMASGDLKQAIADFSKAIELDPNLAELYLYRGSAYADSGKPEQAVSDLEHYLELVPDASNREKIVNFVEALKTGDSSKIVLGWLVTEEDLSTFSGDIGITQWKLDNEMPGQSRICRIFTGVSWSANPNIAMNCVNSVPPGGTFEDIAGSLYDQQILMSTDIALKPFAQDSNFALYAHTADNGQSIFDAFMIGDGVLFRVSVGVGTPTGYTPQMLFEEQGQVIEAFLNNILRLNSERSGQ